MGSGKAGVIRERTKSVTKRIGEGIFILYQYILRRKKIFSYINLSDEEKRFLQRINICLTKKGDFSVYQYLSYEEKGFLQYINVSYNEKGVLFYMNISYEENITK